MHFPCVDINKIISLMGNDHIDTLPPYKKHFLITIEISFEILKVNFEKSHL